MHSRVMESLRADPALRAMVDDLGASPTAVAGARLDDPAELFAADERAWEGIRATFHRDFRAFDRLLLRLHYRRSRPLDPDARARVLRFLATGYLVSGDVRYFNEFLWFDSGREHPYRGLLHRAFEAYLHDGVHHWSPLGDVTRVERRIRAVREERAGAAGAPRRLRAALLGSPIAFAGLHARLEALGCAPEVFYLPSRDRNRVRRWLKSSALVVRLACLARRCRLPYRALTGRADDRHLGESLAAHGLDLAVHRLSFIIRRPVIEAFRLGILNDHLGVLPFVRGRSSVEYSLLFGYPVGATVHFVDEGVDTGGLLGIHTYPVDGRRHRTIAAVRAMVLRGSDDRFAAAVEEVRRGADRPCANEPHEGLQYFTMHPALRSYVERTVIPRRREGGSLPGDDEEGGVREGARQLAGDPHPEA